MNSEMTNLDKIIFKIESWKIPFFELIGWKLNIEEFEKILFNSPQLEIIIGEDAYLELISYDYTHSQAHNDITKLILDKILVGEDEYHAKLFVLIGKYYTDNFRSKTNRCRNLPEAVVSIYEGAHIMSKWTGVDNPACDIQFLPKINHLNKSEKDCRGVLPPSTVIIGYACNSDIQLLMDDDGIVYIYLHITDQLHVGGEFLETLKILFFGLEYGKRLCPDKDR